MKRTTLSVALIALFLAPMSQAHAGDGTFWGTTIGAALGGYIGSTIGKGRGNLAATAAGTIIGAGLGHSYGRTVDRFSHRTHYTQATYYAPAYSPYRPNYVAPIAMIQQQNDYVQQPMPPNRYPPPHVIRVEQGYMGQSPHNKRRNGRHCREFTQTIRIDGQIKESYGIACMRPDGSWQIQK